MHPGTSLCRAAAGLAAVLVLCSCTDAFPTESAAGRAATVPAGINGARRSASLAWQLVTGIGEGATSSVWATSPTDVWASGGYRALEHYDGSTWTPANLPWQAANQYEVLGFGSNDVYTAGQAYGPGEGEVLHWDGSSWSPIYSTNSELIAMWGSSPSNLYVVGDGRLVHFDGSTWTDIPTGLSTGYNVDRIQSIWGTTGTTHHHRGSGIDVWMGAYHGRILHYDGTSVTIAATLPVWAINWINGTGPNDIFAVGSSGGIWHYNGTKWSPMTSGTTEGLGGVVELSPRNVYAAGGGGVLLHYDGHAWSPVSSGTTTPLAEVFALSSSRIYVGTLDPGGSILVGTAQ